jgi:hypothetical protein
VTERGNPIGYRHLQEIAILMLATTTLSVTRTVVGVGIVQIMYTSESACDPQVRSTLGCTNRGRQL